MLLSKNYFRYTPSLLCYVFLIYAGIASAHPDHDLITNAEATELAWKRVAKLVKEGKLEASWSSSAQFQSVALNSDKNIPEFVVILLNPKASKVEKRKLYVFFTEFGEYVAANFSGH